MSRQIAVSVKDYFKLSNQIDQYSKSLIKEKGEEYSLRNDFLAMENKIAGIKDEHPALVSLTLASKHIAAMFVMLEKSDPKVIKLEKWDERIRDGINLLKIASAFVHAEHETFDLRR